MSSTMFSVGTLLRAAEDSGAQVKVLLQGSWIEGRVIGCDGLGAILDNGGDQYLVRLDSVVAVNFSRAQMEGDPPEPPARSHGGTERGPIAAGPVTVPAPSRGEHHFLTAKPY